MIIIDRNLMFKSHNKKSQNEVSSLEINYKEKKLFLLPGKETPDIGNIFTLIRLQ